MTFFALAVGMAPSRRSHVKRGIVTAYFPSDQTLSRSQLPDSRRLHRSCIRSALTSIHGRKFAKPRRNRGITGLSATRNELSIDFADLFT